MNDKARRPVLRFFIHLQGTKIEVLCRSLEISTGPSGGSHSIEFFDKERGEFMLPNNIRILQHSQITAVTQDMTYRHTEDLLDDFGNWPAWPEGSVDFKDRHSKGVR